MISVGWRLREGISAHNTRQPMLAHPSWFRSFDQASLRTIANALYSPSQVVRGEPVSQPGCIPRNWTHIHCLDAFACLGRLASPHHPTQDDMDQRGATAVASTPLIWLICYCRSCACLPPPACLSCSKHARSSQTHKDCIVSSPLTLLSPVLVQSKVL